MGYTWGPPPYILMSIWILGAIWLVFELKKSFSCFMEPPWLDLGHGHGSSFEATCKAIEHYITLFLDLFSWSHPLVGVLFTFSMRSFLLWGWTLGYFLTRTSIYHISRLGPHFFKWILNFYTKLPPLEDIMHNLRDVATLNTYVSTLKTTLWGWITF